MVESVFIFYLLIFFKKKFFGLIYKKFCFYRFNSNIDVLIFFPNNNENTLFKNK